MVGYVRILLDKKQIYDIRENEQFHVSGKKMLSLPFRKRNILGVSRKLWEKIDESYQKDKDLEKSPSILVSELRAKYPTQFRNRNHLFGFIETILIEKRFEALVAYVKETQKFALCPKRIERYLFAIPLAFKTAQQISQIQENVDENNTTRVDELYFLLRTNYLERFNSDIELLINSVKLAMETDHYFENLYANCFALSSESLNENDESDKNKEGFNEPVPKKSTYFSLEEYQELWLDMQEHLNCSQGYLMTLGNHQNSEQFDQYFTAEQNIILKDKFVYRLCLNRNKYELFLCNIELRRLEEDETVKKHISLQRKIEILQTDIVKTALS
jgi:hypothetical protein